LTTPGVSDPVPRDAPYTNSGIRFKAKQSNGDIAEGVVPRAIAGGVLLTSDSPTGGTVIAGGLFIDQYSGAYINVQGNNPSAALGGCFDLVLGDITRSPNPRFSLLQSGPWWSLLQIWGALRKVGWNLDGSTVPSAHQHFVGIDANTVGSIFQSAAAQAANISEWRDSNANIHATVSENGYHTTRKNTAPADSELVAGEAAYWFDSTNGAAKFMIKAKQANGTVRTAAINLS
jgi:uncharacterized iron-regulated membrane protein